MRKNFIIIIITIMVTFAVTGCGQEKNNENKSNKNEPKKNTVLEETGDAYKVKGVELKMTEDQVIEQLGEPDKRNVANFDSRYITLHYEDLIVRINKDYDSDIKGGVYGIVVTNENLCTNHGVKIGDPVKEVADKHGKADKKLSEDIWYIKDNETTSNVNLLGFSYEDDVVTSWGVFNKWYLNQ